MTRLFATLLAAGLALGPSLGCGRPAPPPAPAAPAPKAPAPLEPKQRTEEAHERLRRLISEAQKENAQRAGRTSDGKGR